ncbi:DUF397 domain-containing protein [Jidongwangia harbinensis]|uniref:DUF397 domain-containing protein n=1 Tax=Jidongwangia harbinensis TaxID=2878561 RepID=UPI001CD92160|nr:DUF397 domain-containing protein [Jidongwangia harbinensis]MCA2214539.1 DUF397 domain-containing protein [Jidongwangia harbinensis]
MTKPTYEVHWRRSSRCASSSCVEVADVNGEVLLRDSKNPEVPPLSFTPEEWTAFVGGVKQGEFD